MEGAALKQRPPERDLFPDAEGRRTATEVIGMGKRSYQLRRFWAENR
jgi:hypothetical protein